MAPRGVRVLPTEGRECIEDTVNVALKEFDKNHPPKISRHFIPRNDKYSLYPTHPFVLSGGGDLHARWYSYL